MKKVNIGFLIIIFVLILAACGDKSNTTTTNKESNDEENDNESIDLSGNWVQKGKESEEDFLAGYIDEDRIEIFWMSEGGESSSLYWSGTYEDPEENEQGYYWESINDKTRTEKGLMSSGDDNKTFTLIKDEISFEVSVMGESATVKMIPTDKEYDSISTVSESADTSNLEEVKLNDSGYHVSTMDGSVTVNYAIDIINPNDEYDILFPKVQITAKDGDDKILSTDEMVISGLTAGDNYKYGNAMYYEGDKPESVEIEVSNSSDSYIAQSSSDIVPSDHIKISNVSENEGEFGRTYTGEIKNDSSEDMDMVAVVLVYKSGDKLLGGVETYIDDLNSGDTKPFQIDMNSDFEDYDSYEVVGIQW